MSTTKFMTATGSNRELTVKRSNESSVQIRQYDADHESHRVKTFFLNPADAPALALAILEAAGWPEDDPHSATKQIMMWLGDVVRTVERITAEAKEQSELEAEALVLYNAAREEMAASTYGTYEQLDNHSRRKWLAVARKAREMAKGSTNGR